MISAFSEEVQQSYFAVTLDLQSPSSCENCDKISRYLSFDIIMSFYEFLKPEKFHPEYFFSASQQYLSVYMGGAHGRAVFLNPALDPLTAVSGVGSSPALATCEASQVLLAGVPGGFSRGSTVFAPPTDLARLI